MKFHGVVYVYYWHTLVNWNPIFEQEVEFVNTVESLLSKFLLFKYLIL